MGARDLHIDEAHTALDIFRFAAFLLLDKIIMGDRICGWLDQLNITAIQPNLSWVGAGPDLENDKISMR